MVYARPMTARFGDDDFLERWGTAWSCGRPGELLPMYADDALYVDQGSDVRFTGHDEIARFYRWMLAFSTDTDVAFTEATGDDRAFAARWTWSGTATGPLMVDGTIHETSGARFSVPGVAYCTLNADGLIRSHIDFYDMRAVLKQLDLLPAAD